VGFKTCSSLDRVSAMSLWGESIWDVVHRLCRSGKEGVRYSFRLQRTDLAAGLLHSLVVFE
jgi:hypothetical protein